MIRTTVPANFAHGGSYIDTHLAELMRELKPVNAILQGGLVKAQSTPDMTVKYPDMVVAIGSTVAEVATGNSAELTAAAGTAQVETITVLGAVTTAGDAQAVITSAAGVIVVDTIAVAENDTAAQAAGKMRTAIGSAPGVSTLFTIGGTGADIIVTKKLKEMNDPLFSIAVGNKTSAGLTVIPASIHTTAGVAKTKMAILAVGANGTVDVVYGAEVDTNVVPAVPVTPEGHAKICEIGPIVNATVAVTAGMINNCARDMTR